MGVLVIFEPVWELLSNHSILVMMLLFVAYNHWKSKQPFPESGGRVSGIHSQAEWDERVASKESGVVVVDFFATWCPPCRTAAPVYGALSEKYPGATFVKVDVDECKSVARTCNVSSMPTFQVYKAGNLVDQTVGFSAANIEAMLQKHGLQAASALQGTSNNAAKAD